MPLRIPTNSQTGYKVVMVEYVCSRCDNEDYVSSQPAVVMFCKFCGEKESYPNGEVSIIVKANKKEIIDPCPYCGLDKFNCLYPNCLSRGKKEKEIDYEK